MDECCSLILIALGAYSRSLAVSQMMECMQLQVGALCTTYECVSVCMCL